MRKAVAKQVLQDYKKLSGLVDGLGFEYGYKKLKKLGLGLDLMNKDKELYDINYLKYGCFTIVKQDDGKGYVSETSIEVWDGDACWGDYTIPQLQKIAFAK